LEIKSGNAVVWENNDDQIHTVQSQNPDGTPTELFTSSLLQTGDSYEFKFTESGEFHYYCTIHPWRVGVITVN
jgi:plastocyanin